MQHSLAYKISKNYWTKWKDNKRKIYKIYFFHNRESRVWGINIPFVGYFVRYYRPK